MKNCSIFYIFNLQSTCKWLLNFTSGLTCLLISSSIVMAQNTNKDNSSKLYSAEILIKNSDFKKAKILLHQVNKNLLSPIESIRFNFFNGMVYFESKKYDLALTNYLKAKSKVKYLKDKNLVELQNAIETFIAQTYFALKQYKKAISSLNTQKNRSQKSYLILSSCYWEIEKKDKALLIINRALIKYPTSANLIKQRSIYYAEMGLLHELYLEASLLLNSKALNKSYILFLAHLMKQKDEFDLALKLMESFYLANPYDADIVSELAFLYFSNDKLLAAKDLYIKAAQIDSKYAYQAAETLLRTQDLVLASFYNSQVPDQKKKTKQRFVIELKKNNYNEAYFLKEDLNRLNLLNEDSILYALAYCAIKIGKNVQSIKYLNQIKSPNFFKKALKLKDWTEACQLEGAWKCMI